MAAPEGSRQEMPKQPLSQQVELMKVLPSWACLAIFWFKVLVA